MKVLGIDVGFAITGWSIVEKERGVLSIIDYGVITTSPKESLPARLYEIYDGLKHIIKKYKPDHCAVESLFYFKNQKTVIDVAQVRGIILLAAQEKKLNIFNYTPLQVKIAVTGYGRAEKKQVQEMVKKIFNLLEIPKPDDAADAIAVSFCHLNSIKT